MKFVGDHQYSYDLRGLLEFHQDYQGELPHKRLQASAETVRQRYVRSHPLIGLAELS